MVLVLALVEGVAAPVVVELVIVVKIGVRRVSRHGPRGDGGVSERIPRRRVITRKHFHATESASKLIPGSVSLPLCFSAWFDRPLTSRLPATMNF